MCQVCHQILNIATVNYCRLWGGLELSEPLPLLQVPGFTGSEPLSGAFGAVRICSCLEATDKYVPLPSKQGTARTNKDWRFALKLNNPRAKLLPGTQAPDLHWRELRPTLERALDPHWRELGSRTGESSLLLTANLLIPGSVGLN